MSPMMLAPAVAGLVAAVVRLCESPIEHACAKLLCKLLLSAKSSAIPAEAEAVLGLLLLDDAAAASMLTRAVA